MRTIVLLLFVGVILAWQVRAEGKEEGKDVYQARCAFCHGERGAGDGIAGGALQPPPTDFTSADYWKGKSAEQIRRVIAEGKPGTAMMAFGTTLSPGEIDALVKFLETFAPGR